MTEAQRQLAIKKRHLTGFRKFLKLEGTGDELRDYLMMDVYELRSYIESLWQGGMDWDNYGEFWVVDHIVPFKYFDLSNRRHKQLCWHYENLKPMYYTDNHAKGYCVEVTVEELTRRPMTIINRGLLAHIAEYIEMFEIYY